MANGHKTAGLGTGHAYVDVTDRPMDTILAGRPVNVIIDETASLSGRASTKPPYCVPSMAEIRAIPWNGLTVASTFSGCGGSSLGYRMAGFRVVWANEFIPAARDSYAANKSQHTILDGADIRIVKPTDILKATGLKAGELDLLDGSPPCSSFSTAGKREAGWDKVKKYSDSEQRTDDLFFEFARILKGLQPRTFVAENVSGLVKGTAKGYFLDILKALKACGYKVEAKLLDAQWLGVPQMRQRLIFMGVRQDLSGKPAFPQPLGYRYSVRDALPNIQRVVHDTSGLYSSGDVTNRPCPAITIGVNSLNSRHYQVETGGSREFPPGNRVVHDTKRLFSQGVVTDKPCPAILAGHHADTAKHYQVETDISRFAIGAEWDKIRPGEASERFFSLVKPATDRPCPTVTGQGGGGSLASVVQPTEKRKFTIAELRRICGFPDDFILTGSYGQQWERLGRAVPPVMMRAIAETVRDKVLLPLKGPPARA